MPETLLGFWYEQRLPCILGDFLSQIGIRKIFANDLATNVTFRVKLAAMKAICSDAQTGSDALLLGLANCEGKLHAWICSSAINAELFARDPVAAMRAANSGLPEDILEDLADVIDSIARKLKDAA